MLESPSRALYILSPVIAPCGGEMFTASVCSQEVSPRDKVKYVDGLLKRYRYPGCSCAGGFGLCFTGASATLAVD